MFHNIRRWRDVGVLLMECGAASIVFGILYGTIFGIEGAVLPAVWLKPMENIPQLMAMTLVFGVILMSAGLLINIFNAVRRQAYAEAVFGKQGMTVALLYWLLAGVGIRLFLVEDPFMVNAVWVLGSPFRPHESGVFSPASYSLG